MNICASASLAAGSYLVGAIPIGFLVVKVLRGQDIRDHGSGNIGASNVGRVLGRRWFFVVLLLDALKGLLPSLAAGSVAGYVWGGHDLPLAVPLCGLAAICGHNFSIFLRFKGGKGVATSAGVFLYIFPLGTLIGLGTWLIFAMLSRYASLSSMAGALAMAAAALLLPGHPFGERKYLTAFCLLTALMVIVRHRSNIGRLLAGTENRLGWGCRKEADVSDEPTPREEERDES